MKEQLCGYVAAFRPAWCWGVVSQEGGVGVLGSVEISLVLCLNDWSILKLFDHLVALSFQFIVPLSRYLIPVWTFSAETFNKGGRKIDDFRGKSPFISETVRNRPMVTMERQ